ncbi:hypothetical protein [Pontibacter roseus]|uniref:hypothetical protein n=1 Tax=Pontibacter roseus TaxID=336989 RepID=UPI00036169AF|nr:hypothetical protein [Pontibacter roseus]
MKQDEKKQDKKPEAGNKTIKGHTSQGHSTDAEGSATNSKEPTLRSATTDSSRVAKNPHDDMPTGGNIR